MTLTSQSDEFVESPRVISLFKACEMVLGTRASAYRHTAVHQSKSAAVAEERQLEELLGKLGLAGNPVASQCVGHIDGATARAMANITGWMAYLPPDCVGSMVRDGWHWST